MTSQDAATSPAPKPEKKSLRPKPVKPGTDLDRREHYINRELSWIEFNARVLEEALDERHPLLERVKFLSIFASNLDEFFMIRVSGLRHQLASGALEAPPDGMTPAAQLAAIRKKLEPLLRSASKCWRELLNPELKKARIHVARYHELKKWQKKYLRKLFKREYFLALTPLAFDPGHPFPHISNLSLNLAVVTVHPDEPERERFARLKVPQMFGRLVRIPCDEKAAELKGLGLEDPTCSVLTFLEDVVAANLDLLFPGFEITAAHPFRVIRDADVEIEEDEANDLMSTMEALVGQRHFGSVVRLEVDRRMPDRIREILTENMRLSPYQVYALDGPIGHADLIEIYKLDRPELKDPPFVAITPPALGRDKSIFSVLSRRDVLLYHPFDSFTPVIDFLREAAHDPDVVAIKQTLYRVGPNSPVVELLRKARESKKQVSALVELKARFDEENNIVWARALEEAGVHVVYGVVGLKTHAKMCLVVRREPEGMKCYVHLGTGNYNPVTARIYTDLGLLTADQEIAEDVSDLFNALTGYSRKDEYRKLLVAPGTMRRQLLARIDKVIEAHVKNGGGGHLVFKMNGLVDKRCINALYRASQAGVKVDLQVRGICCLIPGIPGLSDNITVTSLVGRFLEHSRIYYFRSGDDEEILTGSADLMPRNLNGRVETLFPVEDPRLMAAVRDDILFLQMADNLQTRRLLPNEKYERIRPGSGDTVIDSQSLRLAKRGLWHLDE